MSRAFVREKDVDYLQGLPERPISEHPNEVTETRLTQIEHGLAAASEVYIAASSVGRSLGTCRCGTRSSLLDFPARDGADLTGSD